MPYVILSNQKRGNYAQDRSRFSRCSLDDHRDCLLKSHHVRDARLFTSQHFRNSNAGEIPALPETNYSSEAGAWGSMTGFN